MGSRARAEGIAVFLLLIAGNSYRAGAAGPAADTQRNSEKAEVQQILEKYLGDAQDASGDEGGQVPFEIDASLPKLKLHGMMRGLKVITGAGRVTFTQMYYAGDNLIRSAVISRFLTAESMERTQVQDFSITAKNYRFHYKGRSKYNNRAVLIFRTGLFAGELWLDADTARPLRECGQFVKSPSIFLSRINFVRDYALDGAGSHPVRIIVKMRAAFAGPVELTMWLGQNDNS